MNFVIYFSIKLSSEKITFLKIKKNNDIITNYTPRLPKKKIIENKDPKYDIYLCRSCNAEFKRYINSKTNLKCPYCSKDNMNHQVKPFVRRLRLLVHWVMQKSEYGFFKWWNSERSQIQETKCDP